MTDDERTAGDDAPPFPPDPADPVVARGLARTQADLAAHAASTPPMPAELLPDIQRALAAERGRGAAAGAGSEPPRRGPGAGAAPRRGRPRRRVVVAALGAAAAVAAAVGLVVAALPGGAPAAPSPAPTAAPSGDVPVLAGGDGPAALRAGLGRSDYGPLADPGRLAGCLAAHGIAPGARPVGARQVVVDGRPGVLLVLPTGVAARFRLLVVGQGCAGGAPLTVSDTLVGR